MVRRSFSFLLMAAAVAGAGMTALGADLVVTPTSNADTLASALVSGSTVTIVPGSATLVGNASVDGLQQGLFTTSGAGNVVSFSSGIVLTSGFLQNVVGPNTLDYMGHDWSAAGTSELDKLSKNPTFDANVLRFEFTVADPAAPLTFQYVFASDEYTEFVGTQYNDVFSFVVDGTNVAVTPAGDPVSINTINQNQNAALFRDNTITAGAPVNTEMDGLTRILVADVGSALKGSLSVHTMELSIADASDGIYDSAVFIRTGSLSATGTNKHNPILRDYDEDNPTEREHAIFTGAPSGSYFDPMCPPSDWYYFQTMDGSVFTKILDFPDDSDLPFEVIAEGADLGSFEPGDVLDFVSLLGHGVKGFQISGIPGEEGDDEIDFTIALEFGPAGASPGLGFSALAWDGLASFEVTTTPPASVPEPASAGLLLLGLAGLLRRRR